MTAPRPVPPDVVLRGRIITALHSVDLSMGIRSRVPYGRFADAVLAVGAFDVVFHDGTHLYNSTYCRHGNQQACDSSENGREPAECKTCGAACRHTFVELAEEGQAPA
jgi:hypothetical protein